MPRKPATEEQRKEVRKGIQLAAVELYQAKGISGISARAIAVEAGVSVGTIYAHFGNLQNLMQSLWMKPLEHINVQFESVAAQHDKPAARIRALMLEYLKFASDNPGLYRNAFLFVRPKDLETPERQPLDSIVFADLLTRTIQQGQTEGSIRAGDAKQMTELLWAGLHGCIALPINFDRIEIGDGPERGREMIDALLADLQV